MIQRWQSGKAKQPLWIVNRVNTPGDVVDSGREKYETVKFAAAYAQGLRDGLPAVNYLRSNAIQRDVHRPAQRVELRGADGRRQ